MVISILLILVAAGAKAVKDLCASGGLSRWGAFFDERVSWTVKWKHGDPNLGEAWPTSSTLTVFLTSGFHAAQIVEYTALFALVVTYQVYTTMIYDFLMIRTLHGAAFEYVFYRPLKKG